MESTVTQNANPPIWLQNKATNSFCRLRDRSEERAKGFQRKRQVPSQRGAMPAQARNGINGGDPRSGEEAVYAGFDLEPRSVALLGG